MKTLPLRFIAILLGLSLSSLCLKANENWQSFPSIYEVPVDEVELEAVAHFDIPAIRMRERDGIAELKYELPDFLVGPGLGSITFKGPRAEMTSEFGKAKCLESECTLVYNEKLSAILTARLPLVQEVLEQNFPASEAALRLEVARRFSGDPIGIIHFQSDAGSDY